MKRTTLIGIALLGAVAFAAENERVLKMDSKSFTGDLRNGPYTFSGTDAAPVKATVSTLKISAAKAVLSAPAGTPITSAEGKRTAEFTGNVTVVRGRLTAKGPNLTYSEASGVGLLKGNPTAVFAGEDKNDDPVNINAAEMSLDVDTDISSSKGNVRFTNGNQTGSSENMVFDEKKKLGLLTGSVVMNRAATAKQKALNITGTEARVLTDDKLLYVKGNVKLVSGDITTTGTALYYDDKKNTAVIVGSPARSVNAKAGTTVSGGTLEQRTDLGRVKQLSGSFKMPAEQFKLSNEK